MKHIPLALALAALLALAACGDDKTTAPPKSNYLEPSSPENLVLNLETAYRRHEIDEYAKLLAPEFRFQFQPQDANDLGFDTWNRDQDSTGTVALFASQTLSDIRIDLTFLGAQAPTEPGFDPGTLKIRVNPTFLEVDLTDGITWQVDGDIQDMFFRKGDEAAGEDPTRWFLFEWRDISSPFAASTSSSAIQAITWGRIKTLFVN